MATLRPLPHFTFPQPAVSISPHGTLTPPRSATPELHIQTHATSFTRQSSPPRRLSRPEPLRMMSCPPDSPPRSRASTLGAGTTTASSVHVSGAVTPPPTPTKASHTKSGSASSTKSLRLSKVDSHFSIAGLRGGAGSPIHLKEKDPEEDLEEKPEEVNYDFPREFPHDEIDYEIEKTTSNDKKLLGSGAWSNVYRAKPIFLTASSTDESAKPSSRVDSVTEGNVAAINRAASVIPRRRLLAIKIPARKDAKATFLREAIVLSYLSHFDDSQKYIVPFYGYDSRDHSLVLLAASCTLDDWIFQVLNKMKEPAREAKLTETFGTLALDMIRGLEWMDAKGCVHNDIKPGNILLDVTKQAGEYKLHPLYTDFSSSNLRTSFFTEENLPAQGGGTYDFLSPIKMRTYIGEPKPSVSIQTDVWALAITFLYIIIGRSPFDCCPSRNEILRRDCIKQGRPLFYLANGDNGPRNLQRLKALGTDIGLNMKDKWFLDIFEASLNGTADLKAWREELEKAKPAMAADVDPEHEEHRFGLTFGKG